MTNNFKELEKLYIKERGDNADQTKKNIGSNINMFGFVSNVLELYIPNVGNVIKSFGSKLNGNTINKNN